MYTDILLDPERRRRLTTRIQALGFRVELSASRVRFSDDSGWLTIALKDGAPIAFWSDDAWAQAFLARLR